MVDIVARARAGRAHEREVAVCLGVGCCFIFFMVVALVWWNLFFAYTIFTTPYFGKREREPESERARERESQRERVRERESEREKQRQKARG